MPGNGGVSQVHISADEACTAFGAR